MTENFYKTKVRITCVEKTGKCEYNVGDTYVYEHPMDYIKGLCMGIQDPARPWISQVAHGQPSWEADDQSIYRIHCISKKGTVWKLEKTEE
ncbi:MAG: hypothetical protein NWE89_10485 [Candidatus Bathyarchaeota archaeon]|nr:hypothetical protein [Candidatus Bathyarchaeota archaeon]